jgi:hypothetical protein
MNKLWLLSVFGISFGLLAIIQSQEVRSLSRFYKGDKVLRIERFSEVKATLKPHDIEMFELWESILIGRTAPLSGWIKDRYRELALSHLFTPSGFHLSALLLPVMKFIKSSPKQLLLLGCLGCILLCLPGFGALKRMLLIKGHQKFLGMKAGFLMALTIDILFGTFQNGSLSFTYSFLFLGVIYAGYKGLHLIVLFFIAQMLISYFQGLQISPLLLILSPMLNISFGLAMPVLFVLAVPMWSWQVDIAIWILRILQSMVDLSAQLISYFPTLEVSAITLLMVTMLYTNQRKPFYLLLIFFAGSLNHCVLKKTSIASSEFRPEGEVLSVYNREHDDVVYFTDGKCKRRLVNGYWEEKCSPLRKSTRRKKIKRSSHLS